MTEMAEPEYTRPALEPPAVGPDAVDRSFELASIWVSKAEKGSVQWVDSCSDSQMQAYRLWRTSKFAAVPVKYVFLLWGLVETPSWCLRAEVACADKREDMPSSLTPEIPPLLTDISEMLCLAFFLSCRWLRRRALGSAYKFGPWQWVGLGCILLDFADCSVACFNTTGLFPTSFRVSRLCRPFIFLAQSKPVRQVASRIIVAAPRFLDALVSLAICVVIFVWVGMVVFAKSPEGWERFSTWSQGFSSLWVLFTTANFPDVMMPGLNTQRSAFFFFFTYLVVSLYLMNNIMLAAVYDAYKDQLTGNLRLFYQQRQQAICRAFDLLADSSGEVPLSRWDAFFRSHFLGRAGKTLGPNMAAYDTRRSLTIFRVMDYDQSNGLSLPQFRLIIEAILERKIYIPASQPPQLASGTWVVKTRKLILSGLDVCGRRILWDRVVDAVIFIDVLVTFAQTFVYVSPWAGGRFATDPLLPDGGWFFVLFGFSCLYVMETTFRILVLGFERFWHTRPFLYRFDFSTVYVLFIMEVVLLLRLLPPESARLAVLLRLARGLRILRHMRRLEALRQLLVRLLPVYRHLGFLLFLIYYIYATVGVQVFGGLIYRHNAALNGSDYAKGQYWVLNFNDTLSGMMTLFVLMVVNNWYIIADAFIRVTGTHWSAAFFVSFFILVNLIVLNILVTLIIECFAGCSKSGHDANSFSSLVDEHPLDDSLREASGLLAGRRGNGLGPPPEVSEAALLRQLLLAEPSEGMSWIAPRGGSLEA